MLASTDRGSGPPVVLLHGQPGSGSSWDPVTALLEPDFRVLAPDRVGYGATAGEARGLAGNAEVVEAFIRARGASPATVVAHSWSGGVAVLLADRCPALVRSLVLVGAACTPDSLNALESERVSIGVLVQCAVGAAKVPIGPSKADRSGPAAGGLRGSLAPCPGRALVSRLE